MKATAIANANIALVKYWGDRNKNLILPMEGSISVTMDEKLSTKTTVMFPENLKEDEIIVNGKKLIKPEELEKPIKQLNFIRKMVGVNLKAKVVSSSKIPFAAGLAGSSSGLCALALAATSALGLKLNKKQFSIISRIGSGSASRSVYGGFVEWKKGKKPDGSDSYAVQLAPENHWPEFRNIIAIVEKKEKKIKSRPGMRKTVTSSNLYLKRIENLPKTLNVVRRVILEKNLPVLLETTMKESNNLHAVCLDTWPPIFYLNDISKEIIYAIHQFNLNGIKAGYTFDAGPNVNISTLQKYVSEIKKILKNIKGIKEIFVCKIGGEPRLIKSHLF